MNFEELVDETKLTEEYDNFIGIYDGFFPEQYCDKAVNFFEWSSPLVRERKSLEREDSYLYQSDFFECEIEELAYLNVELGSYFKKISNFLTTKYFEKYNVLQALEGYAIYDVKYQKTLPGQGFHYFHYETILRRYNERRLVIQLYLNDVEEGGETEFLYYSKRFKPQKGRFLIYPATFTHAHRGNSPLSGPKYIINSWVEGKGKN